MTILDSFLINFLHGVRSIFEGNASSYMPKDYREKIKTTLFEWSNSRLRSRDSEKGLVMGLNFPGPYFVVFENRNGNISYEFSYSKFVINRIYSKRMSEGIKAIRMCVELDADIPLFESVDDLYKVKSGHDRCYYE